MIPFLLEDFPAEENRWGLVGAAPCQVDRDAEGSFVIAATSKEKAVLKEFPVP